MRTLKKVGRVLLIAILSGAVVFFLWKIGDGFSTPYPFVREVGKVFVGLAFVIIIAALVVVFIEGLTSFKRRRQ